MGHLLVCHRWVTLWAMPERYPATAPQRASSAARYPSVCATCLISVNVGVPVSLVVVSLQ